jgi:hypothetical protein
MIDQTRQNYMKRLYINHKEITLHPKSTQQSVLWFHQCTS